MEYAFLPPFDMAGVPFSQTMSRQKFAENDTASIQQALHHGNAGKSLVLFYQAFERKAGDFHQRTKQTLLVAFKGRMQRLLLHSQPSTLRFSSTTPILTDRTVLKQRLQVCDWCQEVLRLATKQTRNAKQLLLWTKILQSTGFQAGFCIMAHGQRCLWVTLSVPAIDWLLYVPQALLHMAKHWNSVV